MTKTITVRPTGRTFSVFVNGELIEGGFFFQFHAGNCADELAMEYRIAGEKVEQKP